jgi:hypothetical protein
VRGSAVRWAGATPARRAFASVLLRAMGPALPEKAPPRDPIFILGSPRSGTSLLFKILNHSSRVASLDHESHLLWDLFHPLDHSPTGSHEITPDAITSSERRVLYWIVDRLSGSRRYLDKYPRNCLRVRYLHALFPGAWFIHVKRDGRATVSSIMTGWRTESRFESGERLPLALSIDGFEGTTWRFLLPPGWEAYATGRSLEEVAAFQWIAANEAILEARKDLDASRWVEVKYEALVGAPTQTVGSLLERVGLPREEAVLTWTRDLQRHITVSAVTPPRQDKWRDENPREIEHILPTIAPMMARLGYDVKDSTEG